MTITAADGSAIPVSSVTVNTKTQITLSSVAPPASDPTEAASFAVGSSNSAATGQILGNQIQCDPSMNCAQPVISSTDGSNPPVQNVVVGQPVKLTTNPNLPSNITVTKSTWTVDGTNIGGYAASNASASITKTVLKNPSLNTYWVYPNNSVPVTYKYCVNIPSVGSQCSQIATATFNLTGPTGAQMTTDAYSSINIARLIVSPCRPTDSAFFMQYGSLSGFFESQCPDMGGETGTPGVVFTSPGSSSPVGTYTFVQKLDHDSQTYRDTTGAGSETCRSKPGLDGRYPYPPYGDGQVADAPSASLDPSFTRVSRNFAATMYLLWTSSIPNSIPVPIGYQSWHFQASTRNPSAPTGQNWTTPVSQFVGTNGDFVPSEPIPPTNGYPAWNRLSTSSCSKASVAEEAQQEED